MIKWLARHQRFHLHFIPTSSSWLNQVERWFRDLTERNLRRGIFGSVPDLITSIETYLEAHNDDPKPYVWTATAEDILTKVQRARTHLDAPVNQNRDTPLGAHGLLVVDLTQVTFIDACCTGLLLGAASRRAIRVVGASRIVERVLDLVDPDHQQLPRGHTRGGQTDMNPD